MMSSFPALAEYMTLTEYDDGAKRLTSTLLFFVEDGLLKACINDRDLRRTAFFSGSTFREVLQALEDALCSDTVEWRLPKGKR